MTLSVSIAQSGANNVTMRNKIINGGMMIDQRNAGASVSLSSGAAYAADRWNTYEDTDATVSIQQVVDAPSGFLNSLKVTVTTADASVGASQFCVTRQMIEGNNVADLGWGTASAQPVTLSFWVKSTLTGVFGGAFHNSSHNRSYPFTYTISSANTWEQKTVTVAGDTSGTWLTTNGVGIGVEFGLGVGSTYSGTSNAWAGSTYFSATGSTNLVSTLNATWQITGVQLEKGTTATAFEQRLYGTELALCQRYYTRFNHFYFRTYQTSGAYAGQTMTMPVVMRASPTLTKAGTWAVQSCNQPVVEANSGDGTRSFNLASLWTSSADGYFATTDTSMFITASAEL